MGLLSLFEKHTPGLLRIPSGSFTLDRDGALVTTTLPSSFPSTYVQAIAQHVLQVFREAEEADLAFTELVIHYPSLKITAREMRGGAVVFLSPKATFN